MAQIPGLPIDEPVALPKAKPAIFGAVGETIAGLGYETEQMAQANMAFEGHLIYAQRQLTYKQIEIDVGKLEEQAHEELKKSVTPEQTQEVHTTFKKAVDDLLSPHMSDKALARQLHLYSQQVDVEMQHNVNAKKADIITKSGRIADGLLVEKAVQEATNIGIAGGDWSGVGEATRQKLNASVMAGIWMPEDVESIMHKFGKNVEKRIVKGRSNSNDPEVRKQNLEQLHSGEGFKYLDDADLNALAVTAEKRDRELGNLKLSEDYNAAVTKFNELTDGFNYEGKVNVLNSDKWLRENNYIDEHGNPDHKTADELLKEVDRQETRTRAIQKDKDNEIIDKHLDAADTGKLSVPQIDRIVHEEGGSPNASKTLKSALHQHVSQEMTAYRFGEFVKGAEERTERRDARKEGEKTSAELFRKLESSEPVDMSQVWDKVDSGDMTVAQARKVESAFKKHQREDFTRNVRRISSSPGMTQENFGKITSDLNTAIDQQNLEGRSVDELTDKLLQQHGKKITSNAFENLFNALTGRTVIPSTPTETPAPSKQGKIYARDPQGKLHEAAPGTALPDGWKLEKK